MPRSRTSRWSGRLVLWCWAVLWSLAVGAHSPELAAESYLVIITGLGGEAKYQERFHEWATQMQQTAEKELGIDADRIFYLGEKPELAPEAIHAKSTKENVTGLFAELADKLAAQDLLYVLLLGHGSFRSEESRFNLPGPDLTAEDFDRLLDAFSTQRVVFVNTSSASGQFISALSGDNRVVVTATKSGMERNETLFGKYFVEAYSGNVADVDKNEMVSVKEAFDYARTRVDAFYEEENRLKSEHAVLDDNGDGKGSETPGASSADGTEDGAQSMMAYLSLVSGASTGSAQASDTENASPEIRALVDQRLKLEGRVTELRNQKDALDEDVYLDELESLLLEIAQLTEQIDKLKTEC